MHTRDKNICRIIELESSVHRQRNSWKAVHDSSRLMSIHRNKVTGELEKFISLPTEKMNLFWNLRNVSFFRNQCTDIYSPKY